MTTNTGGRRAAGDETIETSAGAPVEPLKVDGSGALVSGEPEAVEAKGDEAKAWSELTETGRVPSGWVLDGALLYKAPVEK